MALTKKVIKGGRELTVELSPQEEAEVLEKWVAEDARVEAIPQEQKDNEVILRRMPEAKELLLMLWHAIDQDTLTKESEFYLKIKAVKDKYPKPEGVING